jgi:hypothetical protein
MAMKNHEYRKVFQHATSIINSVDGVFIDKIGELDELGRRIYNDFSKDRMSEEEVKQLEEDLFREPSREKSSELNSEMIIEAGITQWLQEKMPTKRELEGNLFNKLFQNISGKQQEAAREALSIAERSYNLSKEAFERLDAERRNIMEYVKVAREYHRNFGIEKARLKRLYTNYFPAEQTTPQTDPGLQSPTNTPPPPPVASQIQLPPAPTTVPKAPIPSSTVAPVVDPTDPKITEANDLVHRAKLAIFNGDVGIGVALLVKASELCDEYGDDQRSISLLKSASNVDRLRGKTKDVCFIDDDQSIKDFKLIDKTIHIVSTPKFGKGK